MGLIKAGIGALNSTLADQWKEYFYCDSISNDLLAVRGKKQTTKRSSNTKGNDNVISNGSTIAVADGQCMIIVEQGKVVELCAVPGEYVYDKSTEPSIFSGNLGTAILDTFKTIGKRFTYGGDTGKDQRVYYFNTKEIVDNKFGTPTPIPFRVVVKSIGLDFDTSVRCNGIYTYRIANPIVFYTNVCGNVTSEYSKNELSETMRNELLTHLGPAFAQISALEVRPNELPGKNTEIRDALRTELTNEWLERRGIEIVSVSINSPTIPKEDEKLIQSAQRTAMYRDPSMAAAKMVDAQSEAMTEAAKNSGGAMTGFMGMGMAMGAGGMNANDLFRMAQQNQAAQTRTQSASNANTWKCSCGETVTGNFCPNCGGKKPAPTAQGAWKCSCGEIVTGNFCPECGKKKPDDGWTCSCGSVNKGKFCPNCGKKKPAEAPLYQCDKCGWKPADPTKPPKFCPQCGDRFDEDDVK